MCVWYYIDNMMNIRNKYTIAAMLLLLVITPTVVIAQNLNSTNYQIEDSTFDGGGESSSSTNYQSRDSISDVESGDSQSTNFKNPSGFQPGAYPGIPGTPTFVNTGGVLYNALDFIVDVGVGQQTDATFAIAISSDNFVTTQFIQTTGTLGSSEAWQNYAGWNSGTGERVTGLSPSTTYKIKVNEFVLFGIVGILVDEDGEATIVWVEAVRVQIEPQKGTVHASLS